MQPTLLAELVRESQNDLHREADLRRLAHLAKAQERPSPVRRSRDRLGLLLVAAGTRLMHAPHQPC